MNLDYLRSFFVIVESNSISKAAKKLHLTQPGLSIQLQNLEAEVGAQLLIRSNKGVELTEEGKVVYDHASTILSLENSIKETIDRLQEVKSVLSICACKSLGEYILPCSIYTFKEIYMDLDVFLEVHDSKKVLDKLINHETNIAIVTGDVDQAGIKTVPILKDKLVLVSGPRAEKDTLDLKDIDKIPLIVRNPGSNTREILSNSLLSKGISWNSLNIALSINSPESIKSSLISNRGYAFLPEVVVRPELRSKTLKKINLKGFEADFNYFLAYRENYLLNPQEEKFKKFITSNKRCFCY